MITKKDTAVETKGAASSFIVLAGDFGEYLILLGLGACVDINIYSRCVSMIQR
jgi:hypothetical protein